MNPRESALPRPVAMRLAGTEYDRCAETFRSLTPAQWADPHRAGRRDLAGRGQRPELDPDAADFCRAIARRPASTTVDDLLNTEVPY